MIQVRQARESDVDQVREIFTATYGEDYAYPQYYDIELLKRMVYADDTILLVAEDTDTGQILGTASVLTDVGAFADLVCEFGRLAVHPEARGRGAGGALMEGRLREVQDRLHVGLVEPRVSHPFSQKISAKHGFAPIGFLPMKLKLRKRESVAYCVRYFGEALSLRRNNPRIIPEVYRLAQLALANCGLPSDAIVDDRSAPYPHDDRFELDELTTRGYATLLRFERGRVHNREIYGPVRLHYGLFKLKARHSTYLIAKEHGQLAGAVGFTLDNIENAVRIFELISLGERPIRFLLEQLERKCREQWGIDFIEVDVSAHAPRMQRTLLEIGFLPAAYIPAMVFHDVERLDAVKMVRLGVPIDVSDAVIIDRNKPVADVVIDNFVSCEVLPHIAQAASRISLFDGLNDEQRNRLAATCGVEQFEPGQTIFHLDQHDGKTHLVLAGEVDVVLADGRPVGQVAAGECLGETSLIEGVSHTASAVARTPVETAVIHHRDLSELVRQRPDIGVIIYRNLASGLGEKLRRSDLRIAQGP